jgi:small subunit ribosomal protein S1
MIVKGTVTKVTNFGVFVELEDGLEGLLHISELSDQKVENPQDVVKLGQEVDVKILRVDTDERKIGLSLKRAQWGEEAEREAPAPRARPTRGGMDDHGALGTDKISF